MKRMKLGLVFAFLLGGCTTLERTTDDAIAAGDHISVVTAGGERFEFKVAEVDQDTIVGTKGESLPVDRIARVEKREFSAEHTALLATGIPVVYFAAGILTFTLIVMSSL